MAEQYFPFDSGPGADSYEDRWRRMARVWAPSGVIGSVASGAYGASISGLTVTIARGTSGFAEAWVDGHMHRLVTADWSVTVPANANSNDRVDRIVLRLNSVTNEIKLTHLQGTPAASPVAPAPTRIENGIWDVPLWQFTVPANSGAPIVGLFDDRVWVGPVVDAGDGRVMAYGSTTTTQSIATTEARWIGGLNINPVLAPGRLYEVELGGGWTGNTNTTYLRLKAIAGSSAPTTANGTVIAGAPFIGPTNVSLTGKFTVGTAGTYTISPFAVATTSATSISLGTNGAVGVPSPAITIVVRDAGPSASIPGTTPLLVP